jgi:hypothetical protein
MSTTQIITSIRDIKFEVRTDDGKETTHTHYAWITSGSNLSFSFHGYYDQALNFLNSLPIWTRGKLKAPLQIYKHGGLVVMSEEYYETLMSPKWQGFDDTDEESTFSTHHFPDFPCLYLTKRAAPNALEVLKRIERSYCDLRSITSFRGLQDANEKYEAFRAFKEATCIQFSISRCGFKGEDVSLDVFIGDKWHYIGKMMRWQAKKYDKLLGAKILRESIKEYTHNVLLSPNFFGLEKAESNDVAKWVDMTEEIIKKRQDEQ